MSEPVSTRVGAGGPRRLDDPSEDRKRISTVSEDIPTTGTRYNGDFGPSVTHPVWNGQAHAGYDYSGEDGNPDTDIHRPLAATGHPEIDRQIIATAAPQPRPAAPHRAAPSFPAPLLTRAAPVPAQLAPEPFEMDFSPYADAMAKRHLTVPLIAISGHDGAGKSTLARAIAETYDGRVIAFGDALKDDLAGLGYSDIRTKPTPEHYRALMRAHGGAARITHGSDFWVRRWLIGAHDAQENGARVIVCDDLRHLSELLGVWKLGGLAIALVRPEVEPDPADLETNAAESIREVWAVRSRIESALLRAKPVMGKFPDQVARASIRQVNPRDDADALAKADPRSHLAHLGLDAMLDQELNHD